MSSSPLPLEISHDASHDVDEIATYIARNSPSAAARFYELVDATYEKIHTDPWRWPVYPVWIPSGQELRKRAVIGFGSYLVFYALLPNAVQIFRVLHGARNLPKVLAET